MSLEGVLLSSKWIRLARRAQIIICFMPLCVMNQQPVNLKSEEVCHMGNSDQLIQDFFLCHFSVHLYRQIKNMQQYHRKHNSILPIIIGSYSDIAPFVLHNTQFIAFWTLKIFFCTLSFYLVCNICELGYLEFPQGDE